MFENIQNVTIRVQMDRLRPLVLVVTANPTVNVLVLRGV